MEFILLRHGDSEHNGPDETIDRQDGSHQVAHKVVFAGQGIDTNLRDTGIRDTEYLAAKILELGGCDVLYHSYLKRSQQTAELIQGHIKQKTGKITPLTELSGIEEVNGGAFTGKTAEEIKAVFGEVADHFYHNRVDRVDYPGGETYEQIETRTKQALATLEETLPPNTRPAIVTHANTIKVMRHWLANDTHYTIEDHLVDIHDYEYDNPNRGIWRYTVSLIRHQEET